jgi:hypothetical protein
MMIHICPVCGKAHSVNPARHSVAWGRQFTCSTECESERRRRMRRHRTHDDSTLGPCLPLTMIALPNHLI